MPMAVVRRAIGPETQKNPPPAEAERGVKSREETPKEGRVVKIALSLYGNCVALHKLRDLFVRRPANNLSDAADNLAVGNVAAP
jgi:hypothetical protein